MSDILKARSKEILAAKNSIMEGRLTIWNTRLEALVSAGKLESALDVLGQSIEDTINNCGCNVQCGALQGGGELSNPQR